MFFFLGDKFNRSIFFDIRSQHDVLMVKSFILDFVNIFNFAKPIRPILVFYFRVEVKFAGENFRGILFAVDIDFAGGKFRAKSIFANIAKISSMRKYVLYSIRTWAYAYILIDYKLVHIQKSICRVYVAAVKVQNCHQQYYVVNSR